ncbi:hypothetical protein ACQP2P_26455 [Dactylosporangium sp. CA-139114]|uniref:hypothetical protein n=1 Tax=Dactylosporangium sp. CA-139114 TaxID=3239931 RepID=UPI003D992A7E
MGSFEWLGTATTALVGAAGIGATLWISISTRRLGGRQTLEAEKRQTYTEMFVRGDQVTAAIKRLEVLRHTCGDDAGEAVIELDTRRMELNTALYQLLLVAPPDVSAAAVDLYYRYLDEVERFRAGEEGHRPAGLAALRRRLLYAMRVDLGRSPLIVADAPSMREGASPVAAAFERRTSTEGKSPS